MVTDFHAYERNLGVTCLVPLLQRQGIKLDGMAVLDVGCGYGGVLAGLSERFALGQARGIDLDAEMIRMGREKCPPDVRLDAGDFFHMETGLFDLILLRDVLEHIVEPEAALRKATAHLKPGGRIYASFAPFYGPFGGHQHNGTGFLSNLPWLQFLPEPLFRRLVKVQGNSYKTGKELEADMDSVLRTRLTLSGFRKKAADVGLRIEYAAHFIIRPDYRIKFGLPSLGFPDIPVLEELLCTGSEALLVKA